MTRFSCILLKFILHVDNGQFLDRFKNDWKKNKMTELRRFITFNVPMGAISSKAVHLSSSNLFCIVDKQFSENLHNG